jgi:hypothetical protein
LRDKPVIEITSAIELGCGDRTAVIDFSMRENSRRLIALTKLIFFPWRMPMVSRRTVPCLVVIGFLLLGVTGCGGGPTTGESLKQEVSNADREVRQKKVADERMKRTPINKGQAKAHANPGE